MTPQERELVDELFDRLAKLENTPRDADAERRIAEGLTTAPHAVYTLVQTVLVQDEALKRANARIEELQAQLSAGEEPPLQGSFLDSMRDAVFGRRESRSSVPSVPARGLQPPRPSQPEASGYPSQAAYPAQMPAPGSAPQFPYPPGPAFGTGGSFLGTAASAAAGVIGGALLLDGIRSMFGHHAGFGALDTAPLGASGGQAALWDREPAGHDLARDAGIDHIGDRNDVADSHSSERDDGVFDSPDDWTEADNDSAFSGDDGDAFDDGGSDYA